MVPLDVLVVGGGVQGLWILNDLRDKGYNACLVTDGPLGSGQTLKSHVYLHGGHLYRDRQLVSRIQQAGRAWSSFLERTNVARSPDRPLWMLAPEEAGRQLALWRARGLSFAEVGVPTHFKGGVFDSGMRPYRAFETEETWLNGEELMSALRKSVARSIRVGQVESMAVRGGRIRQVKVTLAAGGQVTLAPRFVVLAAGVGNQQILDKVMTYSGQDADGNLRRAAKGLQRLRMSQMVVIRGKALPSLGCIAPQKLFLVSQPDGDEVVWMNSYEVDGVAPPSHSQSAPSVDGKRLRKSLDILHDAVPALRTMDVKYGVFTALKSERVVNHGCVPTAEYVEDLGEPTLNMRVVWPSKLTLAPLASGRVLEAVVGQLGLPAVGQPREQTVMQGEAPQVATSAWRNTVCVALDELLARYDLPSSERRPLERRSLAA